jgi:hypothetical protein
MIEHAGARFLPDRCGDSTGIFTGKGDVNAAVTLQRRKHRLEHGDVHRISQIEQDAPTPQGSADGAVDTPDRAGQPSLHGAGVRDQLEAAAHSAGRADASAVKDARMYPAK